MTKDVCVDFDGVIHPSGHVNSIIPDMSVGPTPGAQAFLTTLVGRGFNVIVFSSRATVREGQIGIKTWLRRWNLTSLVSDVTGTKVPAIAYVDNRAVLYRDGNWQQCLIEIMHLQQDGG